jgi:D-glycerate 3-kinase
MNAVSQLVLPWVLRRLTAGTTLVVGINGPQGSGKTTLAAELCGALASGGFRATTLSVDDFYLTRAEQVALAAAFPADPYLQQRGYPGTHDFRFGARVLDELRGRSGSVQVPHYDKSACEGNGDRARLTEVRLPLDVVLFEGWMLGFAAVASPPPELATVNENLRAYHAWNERLDAFVQLVPEQVGYVVEWRVEAEARTRAAGRSGMSDAAIRDYIARFIPAYETYLPGLIAETPGSGEPLRALIGRDRNPV